MFYRNGAGWAGVRVLLSSMSPSHTLQSHPQPGMLHGLGRVCLSPRSKRGPTRALWATFLPDQGRQSRSAPGLLLTEASSYPQKSRFRLQDTLTLNGLHLPRGSFEQVTDTAQGKQELWELCPISSWRPWNKCSFKG